MDERIPPDDLMKLRTIVRALTTPPSLMRSEHSGRHEELYSIRTAHRCLAYSSQLDHNILRRGQIWHTPNSMTAYEVLGRSSTTFDIIHWRQWKVRGRRTKIKQNSILIPLNKQDRGAGSDLQCTSDAFFPTPPKRGHYIMLE